MYFSGHSLINTRTIGVLEQLAAASGIDFVWDTQYLEGSSIRQRREGQHGQSDRFPYRVGADKHGRQADVLAEFAARPGDGRPIDTLVVTEQHAVLGALVWQDTIGSLRQLHDSFVQANPNGRTLFFEPWLSIDDRAAPHRWIAYERAASPVWNCIVDSVNQTLERDARPDRIRALPMGLALAELVASARNGKGTAIAKSFGPGSQLKGLLVDNVHLGPAGDYYVAAVLFHYLFPGMRPGDITVPNVARALQSEINTFAGEFTLKHSEPASAMSSSECRAYIKSSFLEQFVSYYSLVVYKHNGNIVSTTYNKWKLSRALGSAFSGANSTNPFGIN